MQLTRISRLITVKYLLCCDVLQADTQIFHKGLMNSADVHGRHHVVDFNVLGLLMTNDDQTPLHDFLRIMVT